MRLVSGSEQPAYLEPYARAARKHGPTFNALLWATPRTQAKRFEALVAMQDPTGLTVLDLGCGKADFLEWLIINGMPPRRYLGVEGVTALADAAEARQFEGSTIVRADFIREPEKAFAPADVIYCSGALNTIEDEDFYPTIQRAFEAAQQAVVFNFLNSPLLAGVSYLRWRQAVDVFAFARTLSDEVSWNDRYIEGDCTVGIWKKAGV